MLRAYDAIGSSLAKYYQAWELRELGSLHAVYLEDQVMACPCILPAVVWMPYDPRAHESKVSHCTCVQDQAMSHDALVCRIEEHVTACVHPGSS